MPQTSHDPEWTHRLGFLVPSVNTVIERDLRLSLPDPVSAHVARMPITRDTPEQLATAVLSGYRAIEPGVPARETHLVRSLALGVGGFGKMPLQGPFLSRAELDEIVAWIDAGMPAGPPPSPPPA